MNYFLHELKLSFFSLLKVPAFCFTIILTLGITLGALITAFNLNYLIFVKPLVYNDHERLVVANHVRIKSYESSGEGFQSYPSLLEWYRKSKAFDEKALISSDITQITSISSMPRVNASYVTPDYFEITTASMQLGRAFNESEGLNQYKPSVILTDKAWQTIFNREPDVLGKTVAVEDIQFVVVGVLSADFQQPQLTEFKSESLVYLPWDYNSIHAELRTSWDDFLPHIQFVGKVKASLELQQAQHELTSLSDAGFRRNTQGSEYWKGVSLQARLLTFEEAIIGDSETTSALFFAGVLALLLIAVANATNLFLSRIVEKRRQLAIQAALGAQKQHIFRAMLAESMCLTFGALLLSIAIALCGIYLLQQNAAGQLPRLDEMSLDLPSIVFMLICGIILSFIFAGTASLAVNYRGLNGMLQSSGKGSGLQISSGLRVVLAASQITLAIILLSTNFSLMFEASTKITQSLGIDTEDTYYITVSTGNKDLSELSMSQQGKELKNLIEAMPEVEAVSIISATPLSPRMTRSVLHPDRPNDYIRTNVLISDNDLQKVFSQKTITGRQFTEMEVRNNSNVVMVSQTLAKALYGDEFSAINQPLMYSGVTYKIISVVEDVNNPSGRAFDEMLYLPSEVEKLSFVVKRQGEAPLSKQSLQNLVSDYDNNFRVFLYYSMEDLHYRILKRDVATAVITISLSILTLLLAAIGLYGILSYNVKMRQYELGVRMAIGANPMHIVKDVLKDNSKAIIWGVVISVMAMLLFEVAKRKVDFTNFNVDLFPSLSAIALTLLLSIMISIISLNGVANRSPVYSLRNDD
ncbi:ABC transporter permease [Pseudoalteromonas rubra]|uniref:ABC transporter permease n=1 Tax=Pseudoalteromonas rubra TaxID=43658 RepID=UPI000F77F82E|nr:ABC transporter permease [Pseudoalteromonas rubra]